MGLNEFWLQSNNGKKFSLENLKELKKSDLTNNSALEKIFNIFNTNGDEKLDKTELNSLFITMQKAAQSSKGKDTSIFEQNEAEEFIGANKEFKDLNINASDLFEFLSKLVKPEEEVSKESLTIDKVPFNVNLTEEQAQEKIIQTINEDLANSRGILFDVDNGKVGEKYNKFKNYMYNHPDLLQKIKNVSLYTAPFTGLLSYFLIDNLEDMAQLSLTNIEEAIAIQEIGCQNLTSAKEGKLGKKEYFLQNREHLKIMIKRRLLRKDSAGIDFIDRIKDKENLSRKQLYEQMEFYINTMVNQIESLEELKNMQRTLLVTTDKGCEKFLEGIYAKMKAKDLKDSKVEPNYRQKIAYSVNAPVPEEYNTTEPMTFEEVFKFERNQEYSKAKVENYLRQNQKTNFVTSAYNKYQSFKTGSDELLNFYQNESVSKYGINGGVIYNNSQPNPEKQAEKVTALFSAYYENVFEPYLAKQELEKLISENNLKISVISDENGNLSLDLSNLKSDSEKNAVLRQLLRLEDKKLSEQLKDTLGGEVEDVLTSISEQVESAYTQAYGHEFTQELTSAMAEDNQTFIQRYTGDVSMTGMGLTVVGGILCFTPAAPLGAAMVTVGNTLAIGGMAAESGLGLYEAGTRTNLDKEEIEELSKTLVMNAGGFVVGMKAAKTGMKAFHKLIDKKLAEVFKTEMVKGNRVEALKQVFANPEYLKSFMKAAGVKLSADFIISYAGDLVMMGVLDTQDDWMSLLQSNLIGILAGMGGDLKDVAHLGMKGDRYRVLRHKEKTQGLTPKEAEELTALLKDPDIKKEYPEDVEIKEGANDTKEPSVHRRAVVAGDGKAVQKQERRNSRYSKPITPYTELGNKIFEVKTEDAVDNPARITKLRAEIEKLRKTEPQKAEELQIVLDMLTNPPKVQDVTDKQIDAVVNYLNDHYDNLEGYFTEQAGEIGISDPKIGRFGHRIKGEWSTRDKIANYIKDAISDEAEAKKKGETYTTKTLFDAFKDVRDKYACRTVFEIGDYTKHPEVASIIKEANALKAQGKLEEAKVKMHEAELKAAELQSEPVRIQLLEAMRKAKEEGKDLTAVRISNYYSEDGIPIFTPEQMESLKLDAAQMGIDVEFIRLAKEIDPKATTEFVDGASIKKQPSGYTALQINFETKTGEVIEWQYRGELVNEFAEAEHLPYDLRTGKHPWAQYPELEVLYKPIADLIDEHVMPKHAYKQLNKYFTDYYTHLRRLELGFESKEPKLSDYENYTDKDGIKCSYKFDKRLEAKNLMALHFYGEGIKDGLITPERALEEFNAEIIETVKEKNSDNLEKSSETETSILDDARYEMSRILNRGKRAATYVAGKAKSTAQKTKRIVRGLSNLAEFALMNVKLKRMGVKDSRGRFEIEEKLKKSNFESEEVRTQIIKSIKSLKTMKVRDWEIDNMFYQLEKVENGERILDKTSVEIISEMEKLYQKASSDWDEFTFSKLTLNSIESGDNVAVLNKIKDLNLAVDRGYSLEDAEQNLRMGIRGEENINLYEEILKSPMAVTNVGGLGLEYTAKEIFKVCQNSQKEVVPENWELLQQFSREFLEIAPNAVRPYGTPPYEIFKTLKNDDIEITKQNLKTFIDAYKADTRSVKIGSLGGSITKEGRLDLSMMGDAEIAGKLRVDAKDLKNPDGTYNQNAIKYIQALRDAGFDGNLSFGNIVSLARSAASKQKIEGEIYSKEIIDTAIELKEYGIHDDVISHIIKLAIRKGVINKELLELYKPFGIVLKTDDMYTLENGISDLLTYGNSEYRPQFVSQMITLLKNGLSLHEIAMSNLFTHEGADGNIATPDIINGLILLKQNDFYAGNLQEVLDFCRKPDGSLNTETLNTFVELKKQGFDEFYLKHIISTATNSKGELNKDNLNLTLQLMKEFKGSEFCRDKDEVYMAQLLMEICTDKSGQVNQKLLEETKKSLPELFKMIDEEDKISFRYILDRALTPDGKFDKRVIEKINELKNIDDNIHDPNYIQTAGRFIEACKDSEGNFSLEKYNDGVMLVKKYGFTKHEVSYKLAPYEDFKSYKNKNNIYDLSLQEKRQLQSLLLRYNSNTSTLQGLKKMLKSDLLPTTDSEYAKIMKQLSQSLGQTDFVLNNIELKQMNTDIAELSKTLAANEGVGVVRISTTYDELLKQIQSKMSGMSESEKLKIYDYFGFTVKDGKIIGFPSANGKSIENSDITNSFSKKVVEALTKMVNDYNKNTQITVEGNPELSRILTSLSQTMPEILNKFSNPESAKLTVETIHKISKTSDFANLREQDKNILIVAALLKDTNIGSLRETAYHIHTKSSKFSWNKMDREKLYNLLIVPERIEEYNNSNPDKVITRNIRHTTIKSNEREEAIDMFAFTIKDRSLDKMSYLLYADKISPELKTNLSKRIYEMKKDDFILPQLSMDNLDKYVVEEEHNGHKVKVVYASSVPDLFAFVHTPEAGIVNYASRTTKLSNFEEFNNIDNDAVICASFVSSSQFGAFRKHGLVFKVPTGHEYVGMSYDMTSLGKNTREMVVEYYRNKGLKAGQGKGMKYAHRTFVSMKLKDTLHITEHSYSELLKSRHELMAQIKEISDKNNSEYQNLRNQIIQINKEIKQIDDDYVARMDKVKEQCTHEQISLADIRAIDPTLARAFEEFLSKTNKDYNTDALMRKDFWNEVLVNGMTVVGEYTVAIDQMPEEYLIKSETEGSYIIDFSR